MPDVTLPGGNTMPTGDFDFDSPIDTKWRCRDADGTLRASEMERWIWVAGYNDRTVLKQFDENHLFHKFDEIDVSKLISFGMVSRNHPPIIIKWRPEFKPIHFYRHTCYNFGTPNEYHLHLYYFGYESPTDKVVMGIMPDDSIIVMREADDVPVT